MPDNYESLSKELWALTGEDWGIWMANTLTEPTCYEVTIHSEHADSKYLGVDNFYGNGCPRESAIRALQYVLKGIKDRLIIDKRG